MLVEDIMAFCEGLTTSITSVSSRSSGSVCVFSHIFHLLVPDRKNIVHIFYVSKTLTFGSIMSLMYRNGFIFIPADNFIGNELDLSPKLPSAPSQG